MHILVFFTIGKDGNHWLACVSDLKEEKNYILDSLKKYRKNDKKAVEEYNTYVEDIIVNVANQIPSTNGYKRVKAISLFPTEVKDVPQQANTFDCGVYVMKFLEGAMFNTDLWTDKKHYKDLIAYRRQIMLQLIKWEKNTSQAIFHNG
ncbi:uncharacterized protein LOC141632982 [Silene latifolia]|uniref:uncharacterized protein LOC141632982 n=1 Tax=Silene latifolia TaxID=37657 RepID=UPI003D7766B5